MTMIRKYNYNMFSIFDIEEYLKKKGYETLFVFSEHPSISHSLSIKGSAVSVDFPTPSKTTDQIFADIRFENYPQRYNFENDKKLFSDLTKKFGAKKNVGAADIKDLEKINKIITTRVGKKSG